MERERGGRGGGGGRRGGGGGGGGGVCLHSASPTPLLSIRLRWIDVWNRYECKQSEGNIAAKYFECARAGF